MLNLVFTFFTFFCIFWSFVFLLYFAFCTNSWRPSVFVLLVLFTFFLMFFTFFLFRNGCGRSRSTCMQNFGLLAKKLSELWSFLCFYVFYVFCSEMTAGGQDL